MSITDAIKDMEKRMGLDNFENYMNAPLPHNGQAYIQRDYKTGKDYVCCPYCSKRNLQIKHNTSISNLEMRCKGSNCKKIFFVDIKDGKEIG